MKIVVLSDIHGLASYAERIIEREQPDEVIFCGDGLREIQESAKYYPKLRFHLVKGNCDFAGDCFERCITLGGKTIFITHGHRYNVKMEAGMNYITLRSHARDLGADLVCFGHTHSPDLCYMDGMILLNPGAVNAGKYAVVEIKDGVIKPELRAL